MQKCSQWLFSPLSVNDLNMYSVMFCVLSCLTRLVSDRNLVLVGLVALNLALAWNTATIPHFAEGNLYINTTTKPHFAEGNLYTYSAKIPHFAKGNLYIYTTTMLHFAEGNLNKFTFILPQYLKQRKTLLFLANVYFKPFFKIIFCSELLLLIFHETFTNECER